MSARSFPQLAWIEQRFDPTCIDDLEAAVAAEIGSLSLSNRIRPEQSVAVTAGSRGIDRMDRVLAAVCSQLKRLGLEPFIVPAMGSHGGATAEGQTQVLAAYGITEENMGVPIRASMDTVDLGTTSLNTPVYLDRLAFEADHIVAVNRIKAHTKFKSRIESGVMKILSVGLGKHTGASSIHTLSVIHSLGAMIEETARYILSHASVLFGVGLVENAFGKTARIKAMPPETLQQMEEDLLVYAKEIAAKIPFPDLDLLIVDRIGKDISGTGMDTNVTGRNRDILGDFTTTPRVKRVLVRDVTAASKGNALGLGLADFCTARAVQAMDRHKTYTNALTGVSPEKAVIPMYFDSDRETIQAALDSLGYWTPESVKVVRIHDTLHLSRIQVSPALLQDLPAHCTPLTPSQELQFDTHGNLIDAGGQG